MQKRAKTQKAMGESVPGLFHSASQRLRWVFVEGTATLRREGA